MAAIKSSVVEARAKIRELLANGWTPTDIHAVAVQELIAMEALHQELLERMNLDD